MCIVCMVGSHNNPEGTIGGAVPACPPPKPMQSLAEVTCLRSHSCKARLPTTPKLSGCHTAHHPGAGLTEGVGVLIPAEPCDWQGPSC